MAALTAQVHQFTQWVGEVQHSKSNRSSSRSSLTGTEIRIEKFAAETTTSTQPLQQMHKTRRQRTTETLHAYTLVHTVGEPRSIVKGSCGNVLEV